MISARKIPALSRRDFRLFIEFWFRHARRNGWRFSGVLPTAVPQCSAAAVPRRASPAGPQRRTSGKGKIRRRTGHLLPSMAEKLPWRSSAPKEVALSLSFHSWTYLWRKKLSMCKGPVHPIIQTGILFAKSCYATLFLLRVFVKSLVRAKQVLHHLKLHENSYSTTQYVRL